MPIASVLLRRSARAARAAAPAAQHRRVLAGLAAHVAPPAPPRPEVVTAPEGLTRENLEGLLSGRTLVLRVPGFVKPEQCERIAEYLRTSDRREQYTHEVYDEEGRPEQVYLGVDRIGVPFNSTYGRAEGSPEWRRYFAEALPAVRALREAAGPEPAPTDRLRLEMDETLPAGASVAEVRGQKMLCGIGRLMSAELSAPSEAPHFDAMPPAFLPVVQQLAANFYLDVPREGGELEIWGVPPLAYDEVVEADMEDPDALRASLPESTIVRPERGDLLLFSTRRPHAIRSFSSGDRVTLQTFFGELESGRIVFWN